MSCDLRCLIFVNSLGIKNGKQLMKRKYMNYCQLSFKVKNKNVTMLKNLPVMMDSSTGNLNPLD